MTIPLVDLRAQYEAILGDIDAAIARVLAAGTFIGGPEVRAFNEEFGRLCDARAVGVASGTDALYLAARALGIGAGDEVIVPSHTFIATAEAISMTGARVVFADINGTTYNLDRSGVEEKITPKTRAVVAVHLYGQPADMDDLAALAREHGIYLIEDAAQAHGATYKGRPAGALGDVAAFSFYPGKVLGAYGDAGAVVSKNEALIAGIAEMANHGRSDKYEHQVEGVNSRLDSIQAAILRVKLSYLPQWVERRQTIAAMYDHMLGDHPGVKTPQVMGDRTHAFHLYIVEVDERDALRSHLAEHGIETGIHYPLPLHLQPAYRHLGYQEGSLPNTEEAARRVLSLPMYPELTEAQVQSVTRDVGVFLASRRPKVKSR